MHPNLKAEMIETIRPFVEEDFFGKMVFLFGHCNATEELCDYLLDKHCKPRCFLDNNKEKQGKVYGDIPIYPPEFIQDFSSEGCIVLIASRFFHSMSSQLRKMGFSGEILETVEYNTFQAFSTEEKVFENKKERMLLGYRSLLSFREQYPENFIVICPHPALGDVYLAMSFLLAYCEKHDIESCVIFTVGNPCKEVAKLFTTDPVISLPQKEMDAFVQAVIGMEEPALLAHHNYFYTDSSFQILQSEFISFPDYYRDVVFGLSDTASRGGPLYGKEFSGKDAIPQGQSVILAPYANSVVEAPEVFWVNLAKQYQRDGFEVFSNILKGQDPVVGTKPLLIPISEMCSAVEWAGHFISLRSGLCEVVDTANACKTVVFPDCCFSDTKHQISDFFKLDGWEIMIL